MSGFAAAVLQAPTDLGPVLKILLIVLFVAGPSLAKLLKRIATSAAPPSDPLAPPRREPLEPEISWRDLLDGRVPERGVLRRPAAPRPETAPAKAMPRTVLSELPDEDELEASGESSISLEEEGAAPPLEVLAARASPTTAAAASAGAPVSSDTGPSDALPSDALLGVEGAGAILLGRRMAMEDWRRAIIASEALGPPMAWREGRELPFS